MGKSRPFWALSTRLAPALGLAVVAVAAVGGATAATGRALARESALPPVPIPLQPVLDQAAPPATTQLPFGEATVSPTAIVAGAPNQNVRVTVRFDHSVAADALLVRMHRPALRERPGLSRRTVPAAVGVRSADLGRVRAGSTRTIEFRALNPPAGRYRIDFLLRSASGPARAVGSATVLVRGQHRLPAGTSKGDELGKGSRVIAGGLENNITFQFGEQGETYVATQPNNPARVIAGVNPAGGNPQAWISNDYMRGGTEIMRTLPSTTKMPTDEGGGTASLSLCCDPTLAADSQGTLWYAVLATGANSHVVINRVAAGATTFQAANTAIRRATTALQDKPMITIDQTSTSPKFGMIYAVWNENGGPGQNTVISQCTTRPGGVYTPSNCDNPDNWTEPGRITDSSGSYIYASVAAAPNGSLYVAWQDYSGDNDIEIDRCLATSNCSLAASWGADTDIDNLDALGGTALPFFCPIISAPAGRVGPQPYVDVGADGRVYVAFSDLRANGTTKCTASGTDRTFDSYIARGATVNTFPAVNSGVRLSNDSATAFNDHFFPSLTVDRKTGEVQSNFYSTKDDAFGQKTNQYYVRSTNGGVSYSAMAKITTGQSDYSGANSTPNDYGDYQGADSAQGRMYPVWTDNRASHGGDGEMYTLEPANAWVSSGVLNYLADRGKANGVTISLSGAVYTIDDTGGGLTAGTGCAFVSSTQVTCSGSISSINADAGDGNDSITVTAATKATLLGGDGNDTLTGGGGGDLFDDGKGADTFNGLGGTDTVTYASATAGAIVNINNVADDGNSSDGPVGARDNVKMDVENITGSPFADTLTGSASNNVFDGGKGADTFNGLTGTDTVTYAKRTLPVVADNDAVVGDDGNADDGLAGARDNIKTDVENLTGGSSGDTLTAHTSAVNVLTGGSGNDTLDARTGGVEIDQLICGLGTDTHKNDVYDTISGCEIAG